MERLTLEMLIVAYAAITGFVAAGLMGSFYQLVTSQAPQFQLNFTGVLGAIGTVFLFVFVGPFIIMRNALRGRRIERRPIGWLFASFVIASMWSIVSGLVVLHFALAVV